VIAEGTLISNMLYRVEKACRIGTGHDAVAAADTPFAVYQDNAIVGFIGSADGANLCTGGRRTVIAQLGDKERFADILWINILEFTATKVYAGIGEAVKCGIRAVHIALVIFCIDIALNPGSGNVSIKGDIVFGLAGLDAETTADTLVGIDQKSPLDVGIVGEHLLWVDQCQS